MGSRFLMAVLIGLACTNGFGQHAWPPCPDLKEGDFRKVSLIDKVNHPALNEPIKLDVAPDGRVFFIERGGAIKRWDPKDKSTATLGTLAVHKASTRGGMGLLLDPSFETNGWIYVVYHPDLAPYTRHLLSRFTMVGERLQEEKLMLSIPLVAGTGNHASGAMAWDPQGNLFLGLGDAISPFNIGQYSVDGYAPIVSQHENLDARRTAANTNDLNGKILRIHPESDGSYTIPTGNLFPPGTALTRPEIYSMGHRNPWTLWCDRPTGWLFVGDVGPDALQGNPEKGPAAQDEFNVVKSAGNYGWPFLGGRNLPYNNYDYGAGISGALFNPDALENVSPLNTGLRILPPARPAFLAYGHDGKSPDQIRFPLLGGQGRGAPISGPVYRYNPSLKSSTKLPPHFDRVWFLGDWERRTFLAGTLDSTGSALTAVTKPFPGLAFSGFSGGTIGPDGALYLIEYGEASYSSTSAQRISRVEYTGTCAPASPLAVGTTVSAERRPRLTVQLERGRLLWSNREGEAAFPHDAGGRESCSRTLRTLPRRTGFSP